MWSTYRWFMVLWLAFGYLLCKGQEVRLPLYEDLEVRAEWIGEGKFMIDSMELTKMIELCRALKAEAEAAGAVAVEGRRCEELVDSSLVLAKMERDVWVEKLALQSARSSFYQERMMEEMKRGRRQGVKWGVVSGVVCLVGGFVVGTVIK